MTKHQKKNTNLRFSSWRHHGPFELRTTRENFISGPLHLKPQKAEKQHSLSIFNNKSCFQTPKEFKILKLQASHSSKSKSNEHSSDLTARNQREAWIQTPASAKRITSEEPNPETERESQAKFALLQCKATWGWIGTKEEEEIYRVIAKSLWTSKKDREKCFV